MIRTYHRSVTADRPSLIARLEPAQTEFLRAIALEADLAIAGAGCPTRGQSDAAARSLGCAPINDLRQAISESKVDLLLMLAAADIDLLAVERDHRKPIAKIATIEPIPDSAFAPVAPPAGDASAARTLSPVHFLPLTRFSPAFRSAADLLPTFGPLRTLSHESYCLPAEGSLGARVFAAMDLVHRLLGEPDRIDAAYSPPASASPAAVTVGETLRGLRGTITANLRFSGNRSATFTLSDQGSRWNHTTTLLGDGGRFRLIDDGFEWLGLTGTPLDDMSHKRRKKKIDRTPPADDAVPPAGLHASVGDAGAFSPAGVAAVAEAIARLLDNKLFPEPPADVTAALALGQTALLSCRTGQPESPRTIRRMLNAE
jgi:hypothetical protein